MAPCPHQQMLPLPAAPRPPSQSARRSSPHRLLIWPPLRHLPDVDAADCRRREKRRWRVAARPSRVGAILRRRFWKFAFREAIVACVVVVVLALGEA